MWCGVVCCQVLKGVARDAMELSQYYQLGCACCLCSLGLCWIPFCLKQRAMEQRAASGRYVQRDAASVATPKPNDNPPQFGAGVVPAAAAAAPAQPAALR